MPKAQNELAALCVRWGRSTMSKVLGFEGNGVGLAVAMAPFQRVARVETRKKM